DCQFSWFALIIVYMFFRRILCIIFFFFFFFFFSSRRRHTRWPRDWSSDVCSSDLAFYWRARCFEKLATQAYLRLYQADPNSYRVFQLMGDLEAAKGNDGKAIEEYRAALAVKPSVPNLHYSLGHLLWRDLKTDDARKEFNAELELNPRHAGALHDLGNTYLL